LGIGVAATVSLASMGSCAELSRPSKDPRQLYGRPADVGAPGALPGDAIWALGKKLFFDPRLSASGTSACSSCHKPDQSWTNHLSRAVGDGHARLAFRTPPLLNLTHLDRYGWTGRFSDLESVSFFAMTSPSNMNLSVDQMLARVREDPSYVTAFRTAFPDGAVSKDNVGIALVRFLQSIVSRDAPFDRWVAGDRDAIDASAVRGFKIFTGKGHCSECHTGWAFTDGSFHDVGTATGADRGRGLIFKSSVKLQYAFKTPTLRNVAVRAPYMHDGSVKSLEEVVDLYDHGGIERPSRAEAIRPLGLTAEEKRDLVDFLKTLTSSTGFAAPVQN
jgi:cytochrome c peroxidase